MSDAVWYYAQNDQEKGPVTTAELRSLAASGKLKPVDLVWKDGMGDWTAASQIKGLLPESPVAPPAKANDSTPRSNTPAARDSASRRRTPPAASPRDARWIDGPPAEDSTPGGVARVPTGPPAGASAAARNLPSAAQPRRSAASVVGLSGDVLSYLRLAGIALTVLGLLLVLAARGCDTLANRYAARVSAMAQVEEERFQQEWDRQRRELEALINKLQTNSRQTQRLRQAEDELRALNEQKRQEQEQLAADRWAELRAAAATAEDDNRAWAFWRSLVFVFGAAVLVPGLLLAGFAGQGPERWICLAMLAIVTFSLFVGGAAWSGPLAN